MDHQFDLKELLLSRENDMLMIPKKLTEEFDEKYILRGVFSAIALNSALDALITKKFSVKSAKYTSAAYAHEWYSEIVNSISSVSQIERGIKVLGLWAVEGRKSIDELIKKGWPRLWKACETFKKEIDPGLIADYMAETNRSKSIYKTRSLPEILLYYMYYHGMKDWPFPIEKDRNPLYSETLFIGKERLEPKKKSFDTAVKAYYDFAGIEGDFSTLFELGLQLSEYVNDEINFFKVTMNCADFNFFSLLENGLSKREADIIAANGAMTIGTEHDYSDALYYASYLVTILCKEYMSLKEKYFTVLKKYDKKAANYDENKAQKELKKAQKSIEKLKDELIKIKENLAKAEIEKRKIEAERDAAIAKAAKAKEKAFSKKEAEYQARISMLEEMLADQKVEEKIEIQEIGFEEKLELIRNTKGILYVCCDETGAGKNKVDKLGKMAEGIKFFTKENNPVPSTIDYIFFDYHIMNHGMYYKIKEIGKRQNIPMYNIQSINPEKNIEEMYGFIQGGIN